MYIIQFPKTTVLDYLKQVLLPDTFEDFVHHSVLDMMVFFLEEKQGMKVNDDCSLWYNRVDDFLMSVWKRRKEISYGKGLACKLSQNNPKFERSQITHIQLP